MPVDAGGTGEIIVDIDDEAVRLVCFYSRPRVDT